jgi:hypothetical protein
MGRQSRARRERREQRTSTTTSPRSVVTTVPLPGHEHEQAADGHFDGCEVCRALRDGDEDRAIRLVREHGTRLELPTLDDADIAFFDAWLRAEGLDSEPN